MFARLYTNNGDVKTAYSELSKVITGVITSPASLTAFNSSTSTIDTTQPSNWEEYTTVGSTNTVNAGVAVWFRQKNKAGRWKYAAIYRTTSPTNTHKGLIRHYTEASPVVLASVAGVATNNSEVYGATTEYTVAAGPRYLVVATRLTTNNYFTEMHMWLEHPDTEHMTYYGLPDHVLYRHFGTGASYATDATTDIAYSTGIVEVAKAGNADVAVYNGGMSTPDSIHGTMKPSYFTSLTNTLSGSSSFVAYPFSSLFYVSPYTGHLDCSTLTNVWGTGTSLGVPNSDTPSGMSLLTCATNAIEDLSTNNFTVTPVGNTVVSSQSPFGTGYSYSYDGSGDYLSVPNNAAFSFGTGDFTIECWVYLPTFAGATLPFVQNDVVSNVSSGDKWWFSYAAGNLIFSAHGGGGQVLASWSPVAGTWYHLAVTRTGGNVRIFIDGVLRVTSATLGGTNWGQNGLSIGAMSNSPLYLSGYISNIRIIKGTALYTTGFTRPTTAFPTGSGSPAGTSILTCASNTFQDLSTNGFTVTPVGDTRIITFSPFASSGFSNYFDGNGDYLAIANNTALNMESSNFTIEMWYYTPANITTSAALFSKRASIAIYGGILLYFGSNNFPALLVTVNGSSWGINAGSSTAINVGAWNHIALTRSGNTWTIWVNGQSGLSTTLAGTVPTNSAAFNIGAGGNDGTSTINQSYISNFRIVKGTALYTSNFTPATSSLPAGFSSNPVYGESVTINGSDYAFLKANGSLSYLVPKR